MSKGIKWRRQARTLTTIEERYNSDSQGPRTEEKEGRQHTRISNARAEILVYDETVIRNDKLWIVPMLTTR